MDPFFLWQKIGEESQRTSVKKVLVFIAMMTEEVIENPFFPDGVGKFSFSRALLHSLLNSFYMKPAGYSVSKMFFFLSPCADSPPA